MMIEKIGNLRVSYFSLVFAGLLILAMFLFLFAPRYYHFQFNLFCMVQYLVSCALFLKAKKKKNYFDFDVIFMISFFFVMFFYPVFMFQSDPTRYFAFLYEFNENVISRATALSLLGMQAYFFGNLSYVARSNFDAPSAKSYKSSITTLSLISALAFLLFILSGGYASLKGAYSGEQVSSVLGTYFRAFATPFLYCALALQFNYLYKAHDKFKLSNVNLTLAIYTFCFTALMLLSGSRTNPLQVLLICGGLFTTFYKPVSLLKFIPLVIVGIIAMFAVNVLRGGEQLKGVADVVMDLIVNNRNTYVAVDYVDLNGVTYGASMLSVLLAPIPFMQKLIFSTFGIDYWTASSSAVITKISIGGESELGLGTNIIADLYMSFGMIGVIVMMFLLGRFIAKILHLSKYNMYALIAYTIMMSYSVFIVRAEFFFASRDLLWGLLIFFCVDVANTKNITDNT